MAQLPNVGNAVLDDAKITKYLLNDVHPQNQGKAKFFMLFGFTLPNWQELRNALLAGDMRPNYALVPVREQSNEPRVQKVVMAGLVQACPGHPRSAVKTYFSGAW